MTGQEAYASGTKQTWRGWVWNRIIERLPGYHPKMGQSSLRRLCEDKTALYLVGPDDHDRAIALSKGFRNENLIAVDICSDRVESVRRAGGVAICGTLQELLANWKGSPVDIVVADFCSGLSTTAASLGAALFNLADDRRPVIAANFLRGRDSESNWFRDNIKQMQADSVLALRQDMVRWNVLIRADKHRGAQFALMVIRAVAANVPERDSLWYWEWCIDRLNAALSSYKSNESRQVFDTIVFSWPHEPTSHTVLLASDVGQWARETIPNRLNRSSNVKGKLAALQAVRTRLSRANERKFYA